MVIVKQWVNEWRQGLLHKHSIFLCLSLFTHSFTITIRLLIDSHTLQVFFLYLSPFIYSLFYKQPMSKLMSSIINLEKHCKTMSKWMVIVKLWENGDKLGKIEYLWSNEEMIDVTIHLLLVLQTTYV
jgi:hypothetical protein